MTETKPSAPQNTAIGAIDKTNVVPGLPADAWLTGHPALRWWTEPVAGLLARIAAQLQQRPAHPARTVVLVPYAQLLRLVRGLWAHNYPDGFAPRFETTMTWCASLRGPASSATDIAFDVALDTLTAQALLARAGLAAHQEVLGAQLVQAVHQLGPLAAACHPQRRSAWAQAARSLVEPDLDNPALAWEAAVVRIALEWAAVSGYVTDVLFDPELVAGLDCLLVVQGLTEDPLVGGLHAVWGDTLCVLPMFANASSAHAIETFGAIGFHACRDAEDEAQRSTACVLQHILAGRMPVALVSSDRVLTRRVRAMLEGQAVQIRDENGWKLSTSSAGVQVMGFLRACVWNASTDAVLNWLKSAPGVTPYVDALEAAVRKNPVRDWRAVAGSQVVQAQAELAAACQQIEQLRERFHGSKKLLAWLAELRAALYTCNVWEGLLADNAGARVLAALRLVPTDSAAWETLVEQALWGQRRMDLAEFSAWVNQALEGDSFQPPYPAQEQVVILPMSQMLGRPFAAVVLAGCDEVRLCPSPEPAGNWTALQRRALGLPSRDQMQATLRAAWLHCLQTPVCDVLWRSSDETGETLLPSPLVQLLPMRQVLQPLDAPDPRLARSVALRPVLPPMPTGALLPVKQLSASGYEDLRRCPYRFFALRQLDLRTVDELDSEVDKRDFGLWIHEVLTRFQRTLALQPAASRTERERMLDAASQAASESMGLPPDEFLPFAAAWPQVRTGYLHWLQDHEANGAVFSSAEAAHARPLGDCQLVGRIDRMDTLADGSVMVLDYKTEAVGKTRARIQSGFEDTQLAFYAALLPHDRLCAAYVNVGERDGTNSYAQAQIAELRDALVSGIEQDLQRIAQGVPLPALGDGEACSFCQARGLCRKDFWATA